MTWPFRPSRILLAFALPIVLVGCADAITVHPVFDASLDAPDVPNVVGTWRLTDMGGDATLIEIKGDATDVAPCRKLAVRAKDTTDWYEGGDEVCFLDLNGYLLAELRSVPPVAGFYRQYLVRVKDDRIEVCAGVPVWVMFDLLVREHPVGYSLDALAHTKHEREFESRIVLIAKPREMRDFLEVNLPELSAACDARAMVGTDPFRWGTFERMTDEQLETMKAADEAADEAAD